MTEQMHDRADSPGDDYERGRDRDGGPRLSADPELTRYFEALEDALHGPMPSRARQPLTWNGSDETSVTFDSIRSTLQKSVPPARPTSSQGQSGPAQAGG